MSHDLAHMHLTGRVEVFDEALMDDLRRTYREQGPSRVQHLMVRLMRDRFLTHQERLQVRLAQVDWYRRTGSLPPNLRHRHWRD